MKKGAKIIAILGPTSSGKSDLAVKLAKKINGEIISADSRQVYKGLNIGSGKITKKEMSGVIHHLLDVVSPKKIFTVNQYQKLGRSAIKKIIKKDKIPIICGGTGFYIDALLYDYKFPEVPPNPLIRKKLKRIPTEKLFERLKKFDPVRAQNIDSRNRLRLIRALEIILSTKKPVPPLATTNSSNYQILKIGIKKTPEELKERIKKRLNKRLKQGMINEIKNLHKGGVGWKRLDDLGLEYRFISRYLSGIISRQEMIDSILKESYKYAKRQITWFKRDKNIHWIKTEKEAIAASIKFLKQ